MLILIEPIIANNNISNDIINHKDKLVYSIFPILIISKFSIKEPSHILYEECLILSYSILLLNIILVLYSPIVRKDRR